MRIVVTGGAGFLGSHLCDRLLSGGHEVLCVDNLLTGRRSNIAHILDHPRFEFQERDITESVEMGRAVDAVLHFASPASPVDYSRFSLETLRVGSLGTMRMLELADHHRARFVLASTSEVYGDPMVHPQKETYWGNVNPIGPRSMYDEAKRYAEALVSAHRIKRETNTGIARIFNTYGPRMRPNDGRAIPTFITQALSGDPVTVSGDGLQTRSVCYVDDLVEGIVKLLVSGVAGPVNIGNPHEMSVLDLALLTIDLCDAEVPIIFTPRPGDDPTVRQPDITRAREEIGWNPTVDIRSGLIRTIEWFRTELIKTPTPPAVVPSPRPGQDRPTRASH
ncbi:UDP-glucuronic acid decarboxylase family protein [Parafrankia sp. FMc2]|uniref:UDP-glucuronic acid decarboxylase family protein n=1 Tax=Parafrankia sp. FMc2 TaxID=3233196 RepID=UPI0034D71F08